MNSRKIMLATLIGAMTLASSAFADYTAKKTTTTTTTTTAQDQSTVPADAELTRKIRQEVMNQDISTEAKNVTIVTNGGKVILTGQVPTAAEKATINRVARSLAPNVDDQLTIKK